MPLMFDQSDKDRLAEEAKMREARELENQIIEENPINASYREETYGAFIEDVGRKGRVNGTPAGGKHTIGM